MQAEVRKLQVVLLISMLLVPGFAYAVVDGPAPGPPSAPGALRFPPALSALQADGSMPAPGGGDARYRPGALLVKFREWARGADRERVHGRLGATGLKDVRALRLHLVRLREGMSVDEAAARYRAEPAVEYAVPDSIVHALAATPTKVPNDPYYPQLWALHNTWHWTGTAGIDIDAENAWGIATGDNSAVVAVIDTGVDYRHPDLSANIWTNPQELPGNGIDDDGNGYVDDVHGMNARTGSGDPMDDHGHGTHVAGTIGAVGNNGLGVVGVNWNVRIMPLKFLDDAGTGYVSDAVECLAYIRRMKDRGVNVVVANASWGGPGYSQPLADAVAALRDVVFVAAAGNDTTDVDAAPFYPAGIRHPLVISTAATDYKDNLASFSNFGRRSVSVGAPGVSIYSTMSSVNTWRDTTGYLSLGGTSMAAPHVAGVAALVKAGDPARDWKAIRNLVVAGGEPNAALEGRTVSGRRINAWRSLACADNVVFSVLGFPDAAQYAVGKPQTLSAQSINCASPVGPVTVTTDGGRMFALRDDGIAPDIAADDGIFTGAWTPAAAAAHLAFASPAGSETIVVPPLVLDPSGTLPLPYITAGFLPDGFVGKTYGKALAARGGLPPYAWSVTSGSLPEGLALDPATGEIAGVPTGLGTATFTVTVTEGYGTSASREFRISTDMGNNLRERWKGTYTSSLFWHRSTGVAVDDAGNVFVSGYAWPSGSFSCRDFTAKFGPSGTLLWVAGNPNPTGRMAYDVAADAAGSALVAGTVQNGGGYDFLITRYDADGNQLWSRTEPGPAVQYLDGGPRAALDAAGNVVLAGARNAGGGSGFLVPECFVARYDPAGNPLWRRNPLDGISGGPCDLRGVATDASGNVYATGTTDTSAASSRVLLVKYDSAGNLAWRRTHEVRLGADSVMGGTRIAVGGDGSLYLLGHEGGMMFVARADDLGNLAWVRPLAETARGITLGADGRIYLTGLRYEKGVAWNAGGVNTVEYDTDGNYHGTRVHETFAPSGARMQDEGSAIAADRAGNPYVAGHSTGNYINYAFVTRYGNDFSIDARPLGDGVVGGGYAATPSVLGGDGPFSWTVLSGRLPDGLALDPSTGTVSGVPTSSGTFDFLLGSTDATDNVAMTTHTIETETLPLSIVASLLPGMVGQPYLQALAATGGRPPYAWSVVSGSLPEGLALDNVSGRISGTPTRMSLFPFTVGVRDAASGTAIKTFAVPVGREATWHFRTASGAGGAVFRKTPQYATLGTGGGDGAAEDVVAAKFRRTRPMLIGYLAEGGYTGPTKVTASAAGNSLSFLAKDSGGHALIELVELDPVTRKGIRVLAPGCDFPIAAGRLFSTSDADLSALSGTVAAGKTFGIRLSIGTEERSANEIRWGKAGGGPGFGQWIRVTEMPQ